MAYKAESVTIELGTLQDNNEKQLSPSKLAISHGLEIVVKDLSYSILIKKRRQKAFNKPILKSINAVFRPGKLTAVMGASGAGKTSLLNIVAGDSSSKGIVSGEILVNGEKFMKQKMKKISGFVFQDDVILETMTVREAISMSAICRLPKAMSMAEKIRHVNEIIKMLYLEKCADSIIGSPLQKGISGGERKRTSIAMELVTDPPIIFLDEPTSGLDTYTAYSVISSLADLAEQGRTVVATIHQPSSDIFHMFDDLLLLAEGEVMYCGVANQMVDYFARQGFQCPQYTNPADYMFMSILNNVEVETSPRGSVRSVIMSPKDNTVQEIKETPVERIQRLLGVWKQSPEAAQVLSRVNASNDTGVQVSSLKHPCGFTTQFPYLMKRAGKNVLRNKLIAKVKLGQHIFLGLVIGLIYLNVNNRQFSSQSQDRLGALFFIVINMFMSSAMSILSVFSAEKAVFVREFSLGYYSLPAYFFSKVLIELPFYVLFPIVLVSISYWMIGFQNLFYKYVIQAMSAVLVALCGTAVGILAACAFEDFKLALIAVPMIVLPFMLFSGFFVNSDSIPVYFNWIKYISPVKYGFASVAENEFTGLVFGVCPNPGGFDCTGESVLQQLALDDSLSIAADLGILVAMYVGLLTLSYLSLLRITWRKK